MSSGTGRKGRGRWSSSLTAGAWTSWVRYAVIVCCSVLVALWALRPLVAGDTPFVWDGTNTAGEKVDPGTYTFKASAQIDGKATDLITYLPATVNSVTLSQTGGEMMLNLANMGSIALSKVQTIGL